MGLISDHKVFHGGTYNTNPVAMAAGLAMFREVLTPAAYEHVNRLNKRLLDGYNKEISKTGLKALRRGRRIKWLANVFPEADSQLSRLAEG